MRLDCDIARLDPVLEALVTYAAAFDDPKSEARGIRHMSRYRGVSGDS